MKLQHYRLLVLAGITYFTTALAQSRIKDQGVTGGYNDDAFSCMYLTKDGGLIVGGSSSSNISDQKTENSRDATDYRIVKLDASGYIQLDKTIGGAGFDYLYAVQQTTDGGYILSRASQSNISGEKTENSRGYNDYRIVRTNSNGKVQWNKTIGGSFSDYRAVVQEIKKDVYVVGGSSTSGISGDKTAGNRGEVGHSTDYWLLKLKYIKPDSTAITQMPNTSKLNAPLQIITLLTYPNPATDKLTIQSKGKATFTLTNQQGKVVITKTIVNNGSIDVSHLPAGVYHLTNTATGATQKIVVNK